MFLTQNNKHFLSNVEIFILASNIMFWNGFNISTILHPQKIIAINYCPTHLTTKKILIVSHINLYIDLLYGQMKISFIYRMWQK